MRCSWRCLLQHGNILWISKGTTLRHVQQPALTGLSLTSQVYHALPTATTPRARLRAQRPAAISPAPLSANPLVSKAVNASLATFSVTLNVCLTKNVAAPTLTNITRYSLPVGHTPPTAPPAHHFASLLALLSTSFCTRNKEQSFNTVLLSTEREGSRLLGLPLRLCLPGCSRQTLGENILLHSDFHVNYAPL